MLDSPSSKFVSSWDADVGPLADKLVELLDLAKLDDLHGPALRCARFWQLLVVAAPLDKTRRGEPYARLPLRGKLWWGAAGGCGVWGVRGGL